MDNQRDYRQGISPDHLEENPGFHSSHPISPARGSLPRGHRFHHLNHRRAGPGPQYQTWSRNHSHNVHASPRYMLQRSTQNCQIRFHSAGSVPVSTAASAPMYQRTFPNAGQPSAQRQHQRSHRRTFQQPRNNRNQSRAIGHQLSELRLEDENGAAVMQPGFRHHHHHSNGHRHHRRGRNHHQAMASHACPARTLSQPQNPQVPEAQAVPTGSSGQLEAIAQSQPLLSDHPAETQSQPDNRQGQEIRLEEENDATALQPGFRRHRNNRQHHHRSGHNHHQTAASYALAVHTQSQPQNPQEPEAQAALTESSGQREATAQSQPLPPEPRNLLPAQTQSQPDNRQGQENSPDGNQSQQSNTTSQDQEDRLQMTQMVLRRLFLELRQRTRNFPSSPHENLLQLPSALREDRVDTYIEMLMTALRDVLERPQEAMNHQEMFYLFERVEYSAAEHFTTIMLQINAAAIQNNAVEAQHCAEMARHMAEEAQHYAVVAQNFAAVTQHVAAAAPHNDVVTQHIGAATHHISAAIQHRYAIRQHLAVATHSNAAETQSNIAATHLSDIAIEFTSDEDVGDILDDIGEIPDYHSSPDNGLSVDTIQEIPTRQFSRGAERSGSDQTSCVFCMCDFEDKQLLRILPCFHEFHAECVDEWLKTHRTCPLCRHDVETGSGQG
ncbi:E3 ubiquitin-protein ligase rnf38 [Plakobranchus ocellatus]|uniref:E3 ubiquitin-protein ligase rnf38 n=1 Tax=Plakobranchus ocellatus TaxID=259542 RepID=A0AAV4E1J4_9GAST|nr:E3 ubiquitin-protein ligase rnf38 [Plakobranchus ocellatus]